MSLTAERPTIATPDAQQRGPTAAPTTASTRKTAALVALMFLTATAAFIVADSLISAVLARPDLLTGTQTSTLAIGALMLFGQFGVVGIAVLLFPPLKPHGEALALAHVGFRVAELAASLFYLAVPLLAIELGARAAGPLDAGASTSLAALLQAQHSVAILLIYLVTSAGGMCMAVLLFRSRLIPRPMAVLGLVGYPALLAGCALDLFGVVDMTRRRPRRARPGRRLRADPAHLAACQGVRLHRSRRASG